MRDEASLSYLASGWLATFNYMGYMTGALLAASISRLQVKYHLYRIRLVVAVISTAGMGLTDSVVIWAILRYIAGLTTTCGMLIASYFCAGFGYVINGDAAALFLVTRPARCG